MNTDLNIMADQIVLAKNAATGQWELKSMTASGQIYFVSDRSNCPQDALSWSPDATGMIKNYHFSMIQNLSTLSIIFSKLFLMAWLMLLLKSK